MSAPRHSPTILVVDDQRYARQVAYRSARRVTACWRLRMVQEARDAMDFAKGRVDLLFIDVVMPKMDGVELAQNIWDWWPDKRVLFTSGRAAEVLAEHGLTELDSPFLPKPYTRDEILKTVEKALATKEAAAQGEVKD